MNDGTVLYVEDEENDVLMMRRAWAKAGLRHHLQVVTDGEEALRYLCGEGKYADRTAYPMPCLVLLDLKLPKLSGMQVLKWIRQQPAIHTLQIIMLSSSNQATDIHTAHALGANAYLVKPDVPAALMEVVVSLKEFWLNHARTPPDCLRFEISTIDTVAKVRQRVRELTAKFPLP